MPLSRDVSLEDLAKSAEGYSGADIEAVCREAAMIALRRDIESKEVTLEDFKKAMEGVRPSITSEVESWYQGFVKRYKQERPPLQIA
jgi:transitional endoplasmic reticulum ATPase